MFTPTMVSGIVAVCVFGIAADELAPADPHAKGCRLPTQLERQWFENNSVKVQGVGINELGLTRINDYRHHKGMLPLTIMTCRVGQEVISSKSDEQTAGLKKSLTLTASLPDQVDNSRLPYFPPVSSQGSLNCCSAFSTTYYQFSYMANMANNTPVNGTVNLYSTKWTFDFVNDGGDNGTNFTDTYKILMKNGCASLKDMPYDTNCTQWSTSAPVWRAAMNYRIDKIGSLGLLQSDSEMTNLKTFLVNGYVIAFSTDITNWHYIKIKDDPATTADNAFVGQDVVAWTSGGCDHAMCIVGYNDNIWTDINGNGKVDSGEKGALRIVNSWGPGYEDSGYTWIAYDALTAQSKVAGNTNTLKGDLIDETAWCTVKPSYAPALVGQFTLSTARRNQIVVKLGYSTTDRTTPMATWDNEALDEKGGALAFNGTTSAVDGAFCLDFTNLIDSFSLANGTTYRWYCIVSDTAKDNFALTIRNFSILDTKANRTVTSTNAFPATVDGTTFTCYADLALDDASGVSRSGGRLPNNGNSPVLRVAKNIIRLMNYGLAVHVSLLSLSGRVLMNSEVTPHSGMTEILVPDVVPNGSYLCSVQSNAENVVSKMIVIMR